VGARAFVVVTSRRSRWRAYLLLSRVSNLPTVWTNVLAGTLVASVTPDWRATVMTAAAMSLFYTGGMFLNDAFDEAVDRVERPERPLPAGDVGRVEVFGLGAALLAAGLALLPFDRTVWLWGFALAAAILLYDLRHKGVRYAPLVMGLCRGLVYCVAAAAASRVTLAVLGSAAVMMSYVSGLTIVAKLAGPRARWLVPLLIAAISLVDAAVIAIASSSPQLAWLALLGFPATLALQRVVPGD
jgi:4-hydroxybenzoate polyprenyltransferase